MKPTERKLSSGNWVLGGYLKNKEFTMGYPRSVHCERCIKPTSEYEPPLFKEGL